MEESIKQYLEDLYSCVSGAQFLGLWESDDKHLEGSYVLYGPKGLGKIATRPSVWIYDDIPQEQVFSLLEKCLDITGIQNECYLYLSLGPWAHMKILDRGRWLRDLWRMKIPGLDTDVDAILLLSAEKSKAMYFRIAEHHIIEVYLADLNE